jgi:hypothetical protein
MTAVGSTAVPVASAARPEAQPNANQDAVLPGDTYKARAPRSKQLRPLPCPVRSVVHGQGGDDRDSYPINSDPVRSEGVIIKL